IGEVEDDLALLGFDPGEAQLAVLVLLAEALEGATPGPGGGHPAEPGEEVGPAGPAQAGPQHRARVRAGPGGEGDGEGARGKVPEFAHAAAVEGEADPGGPRLGAPGRRMRPVFAADHEAGRSG